MRETLDTLRAWRRQRFDPRLFVPVALTLTLASLVGAPWPSPGQLALRVAAAWLAVFALRLWDDFEDRRRDAQDHPERVLAREALKRPRPYAAAVLIALTSAVALTHLGGGAAWRLVALIAGLMAFYRLGWQTRTGGDFLVLLKYPLLVLALGAPGRAEGAAALTLVMAGTCADELLQGPSPARWAVVTAMATMMASACALIALAGAPLALVALQAAVVVAVAAIALMTLLGAMRPRWTRGGLLAATLTLLTSSNGPRLVEFIHAS